MDVGRHPRIELLTHSEVENVTGFVGNFAVQVRKKARFVDPEKCTACGDCADVCPSGTPDEYQQGFSTRKAVYIPFPQAVPSSYVIDMDTCLGNNPIACGKCETVCEKDAIDFDMADDIVTRNVGTIIVATGMKPYDPSEIPEYGYGRFPNVITSMEFERLICSGGPTEGHFVRPGDATRPKRIGFVQCVGSRSTKFGSPYCSNICCMNTVKDTLLLRDHYPDTEAYVFYTDIRAFAKGFEEMFVKSKEAGVKYIRGLPGEISQPNGNGNLAVKVENTLTGRTENYDLDMVVLSVGVEPQLDAPVIRQLFNLSASPDGFMLESHPKLKPVDAPTRGVYFAGCAESPKDIKDSVTQAGAAAARSQILLNAGEVRIEAITSKVDKDACKKCGKCATVCPYGAIHWTKGQVPEIVEAACAGCGNCGAECPFDAITMRHFTDHQLMSQIDAILAHEPEHKLVTFACNWCSYAGGDLAGISRLQYPAHARLIRTMCSARVSERFIEHAFRKGAPMVLVSGCHYADCHYINANRSTVKRVNNLWKKMEQYGIRPDRLQLEWISAAEGQKFAKVMDRLNTMRKQVSPEEITHSQQVFQALLLKGEKRKAALDALDPPKRLKKVKVDGPAPDGQAWFQCLCCGNLYTESYNKDAAPVERTCTDPACRSNSIRRVE